MSESKNPLNAYNQFETIRAAVDQLETIHVYNINSREHGDTDTPSLKNHIADLDKQILEYEVQLGELQLFIEQIEAHNKILLGANNELIRANKIANESNENLIRHTQLIIDMYNKLPRIVKRIYGVK